jgi:hypothetical protein
LGQVHIVPGQATCGIHPSSPARWRVRQLTIVCGSRRAVRRPSHSTHLPPPRARSGPAAPDQRAATTPTSRYAARPDPNPAQLTLNGWGLSGWFEGEAGFGDEAVERGGAVTGSIDTPSMAARAAVAKSMRAARTLTRCCEHTAMKSAILWPCGLENPLATTDMAVWNRTIPSSTRFAGSRIVEGPSTKTVAVANRTALMSGFVSFRRDVSHSGGLFTRSVRPAETGCANSHPVNYQYPLDMSKAPALGSVLLKESIKEGPCGTRL